VANLSVILFMRSTFVVGQAGVAGAIAVLLFAQSIALLTALSAGAVFTNTAVRGGGAYYAISRALGSELGGAIGLMLFLAQTMAVSFYALAFSIVATQTFPPLREQGLAVALIAAGCLFAATYVRARWTAQVHYVILGVLGVSIFVFLTEAALRFSPENFTSNLWPSDISIRFGGTAGEGPSLWMLFAVFFPAVTGLMAGANPPGELKEPPRNVSWGILAAMGIGLTLYLVQILISGGASSRDQLLGAPCPAVAENALLQLGFLVAAGLFAATLSSGFVSLLGASRVLQAVARDNTVGALRSFAEGSRDTDEPRRGIAGCALIALAVIFGARSSAGDAALDLVARMMTLFSLYAFATLNLAAFIQDFRSNPLFRPRFRYFHWGTALAGSIGCIVAATAILWWQSLVTMALLGVLAWTIKRRELTDTLGDSRRGQVWRSTRNHLMQLTELEETPRKWRPAAVVFSENPERREALVMYSIWMEAGRGLVFLANVLVGNFEENALHRATAARQLREFCRKRAINAFPVVVIDENLENGMTGVMQALSMGPLRTNLAVFEWSDSPARLKAHLREFCRAKRLGMNVAAIHPGRVLIPQGPKRVDIWWRGRKNGELMAILGHLLTCNWEWTNTRLRVLRQIGNETGRESALNDLTHLLRDAHIEAETGVVVSEQPFAEILAHYSSDASCVFLGFEVPPAGHEHTWFHQYESLLLDTPATILVSSIGADDLMV
jgi:amino acid transporter